MISGSLIPCNFVFHGLDGLQLAAGLSLKLTQITRNWFGNYYSYTVKLLYLNIIGIVSGKDTPI